MTNGTTTWDMTYNADGLRTGRTNGTNEYTYWYNESSQLVRLKYGPLILRLTYGNDGRPISISYNGNTYYYILNQQGDVMALLDSSGNWVVKYTYDAWGNILSTIGSTETMYYTLAQYNPLRYRGYIYDRETKLYYLQSRYYNPEIGRFINADAYTATGQGLVGNNMFTYGGNNPVVRVDPSGESFAVILGFNFNLFGWGMIGSINLVSTKKNWGVQYSYYLSDDAEISKKKNQTVGVDVGSYIGIQYTDKNSMDDLKGSAKATGGDLILGGDILTDERGKYLGWQFGSSGFSANMHSLYTNTETLFCIPTIDLPKILINWIFGE